MLMREISLRAPCALTRLSISSNLSPSDTPSALKDTGDTKQKKSGGSFHCNKEFWLCAGFEHLSVNSKNRVLSLTEYSRNNQSFRFATKSLSAPFDSLFICRLFAESKDCNNIPPPPLSVSPLGPWAPILPRDCLVLQGWLSYSLRFILAHRLFIIPQNSVANELFLHSLLLLILKKKRNRSYDMTHSCIIISQKKRSGRANRIIRGTAVVPVRTINIRQTCPPTDASLSEG